MHESRRAKPTTWKCTSTSERIQRYFGRTDQRPPVSVKPWYTIPGSKITVKFASARLLQVPISATTMKQRQSVTKLEAVVRKKQTSIRCRQVPKASSSTSDLPRI